MKRKNDPEMPQGKVTLVEDFLPPPAQLHMPKDDVKITIALSRRSVAFFKRQAMRYHAPYQRMIREVVDRYALRYE